VFSNFSISQDNGKGTSESVQTLMNLIDQSSGREVATQNVSLYNYYSQRSYGAEVVSLGNAMIQPTMYFNLRHVPMFNGPYLITEVNHTITPGQFQTKFSGTRQGIFDLPAIDNFLQSINQNLLTKLEKSVLSKDDGTPNSGTNSVTNSTNSTQNANNTSAPDNSCKANTVYGNLDVSAATETTINESDLSTKIKNATTDSNIRAAIFALCYLRTYKTNGFTSFNNNYSMVSLSDERYKSNASTFIKNYSCVNSETANKTVSLPIANFKDVDTFIGFMRDRLNRLVNKITQIGLHQFYICEWQNVTVSESNFSTNRYTLYKESYDGLLKGLLLASNYGIVPTVEAAKFLIGKSYTPPAPTPSPTPTPTASSVLATFPPQQITLRNLGSFPSLQGREWSYFNIKKLNGGYLTFQLHTQETFDVQKIYDYTFVDAATNEPAYGANTSGGIDTNYTHETIIGRAGQFKLVVRYIPYGWTYPSGGQLLIQTITSDTFTL
jgi:hypothetical protein